METEILILNYKKKDHIVFEVNKQILNEMEPKTIADVIKLQLQLPSAGELNLRSSRNDEAVKKLIKDFSKNREKSEEVALNYLCSEVHHPVISCFRELTKTDFTLILNSSKLKKHTNTLQYSLTCLGMIDYMAIALDNPIYCENFKNLAKLVPIYASKILAEFKIIFRRWSVSDSDDIKKRCGTVIAYLRQLAPKLSKACDFDFNEAVDCLESCAVPRLKFGSTDLSLDKETRDLSSDKAIRDISSYKETQDLSSDKETRDLSSDKEISDPEERTVLSEIRINTSIFVDEDDLDLLDLNTPRSKSRIICNKLPSPPCTYSPQQLPIANPKKANRNLKRRAPFATLTRVLVPPPEIVDIDCETPNEKRPRLESQSLNSGKKSVDDKPKLNAFAILMNRSREIAQADKLRRNGGMN